jgi:hypothetical protein
MSSTPEPGSITDATNDASSHKALRSTDRTVASSHSDHEVTDETGSEEDEDEDEDEEEGDDDDEEEEEEDDDEEGEEEEEEEESTEDDEEEEDDDDDEEPKLNYQRLGAGLGDMLMKDSASATTVSERFLVCPCHTIMHRRVDQTTMTVKMNLSRVLPTGL